MSNIEYTKNDFKINGTSTMFVADNLKQSGLSPAVIAEIIGGWFVGVTGNTNPAPFDFTTDVQSNDVNCRVTYARTFSHTDWIDGESRVQAGMTPEELGVNARFHGIENEFDAVADQFRRLGNCVGEIRLDLVGIVGELETKITTLQNEIKALQQEKKDTKPPTILGTTLVNGKEALITQFGNDFKFVGYEAQTMIPPKGVQPGNPNPLYDPTKITGKGVKDLVKELDNTLVQPQFGDLFEKGTPVTIGDVRNVGGTTVLPSGYALGSVLATMPAETSFANAGEAIAAITEHVVSGLPANTTKNLRESILSDEASGRTGTAVLNSSVAVVGADKDTTSALSEVGLGTVGKLSNTTSLDASRALTDAGLNFNEDAIGGLVADAHLGRALRNLGIG